MERNHFVLSRDQKIDPEFVEAAFQAARTWVRPTETFICHLAGDGDLTADELRTFLSLWQMFLDLREECLRQNGGHHVGHRVDVARRQALGAAIVSGFPEYRSWVERWFNSPMQEIISNTGDGEQLVNMYKLYRRMMR